MDKVLVINDLQQQLLSAEAALKRERDRADLLASELHRLRTSVSAGSSAHTSSSQRKDTESNDEDLMVLVPRSTLEMLHLKERAMNAVTEGITIADATAPDMPLVYANEGFARLTGYPFHSFSAGKNCRFLQGPGTEEAAVRQLSEAVKAGQPCVVQITNYKKNGSPFLNYLSLTPVHDAQSGAVSHYVGVQSDITELVLRRRAELAAKHAAVEAAAATEAKSQFLARMSHEIRTPLNGMIAVGQLLADTQLTPSQWDLVNTIRCSGEALLTLISDILDFSKIEANKMVLSSAPFALEATIEAAMEIAGLHAAQKKLQVAYNVAPNVPLWIVGDAQRLQQVLLNILNNALKFTEAGEVLLEVWAQPPSDSTASEPAPAPEPSLEKNEEEEEEEIEIHFSVRDTGIGISTPDLLVRLFQSFSQLDASPTRRYGGSGLGLAISQKLSEAMAGKMWAESAGLGCGSTFRWCITTKKASAKAIAAAQASQGRSWGRVPSSRDHQRNDNKNKNKNSSSNNSSSSNSSSKDVLRGKRVLLVEPCEMVRQVMVLALRQWGLSVCAVGSERAAVAKLNLRAELEELPPTAAAAVSSSRLSLMHAGSVALRDALAASAACCGPFDVVVLDVSHTLVLHALMDSCERSEAERVVFLGWPGSNDPEESEERYGFRESSASASSSWDGRNDEAPPPPPPRNNSLPREAAPPAYASGTLDLPAVVVPPRAITDAASAPKTAAFANSNRRQLGYVLVSRPVRQGRLRLGLEEVLQMEIIQDEEEEDADVLPSAFMNDIAAMNIATTTTTTTVSPSHSNPPTTPLSFTDDYTAAAAAAVARSEKSATTTTSSTLRRSVGSTGSLLQAAPIKRISSGSSLTTNTQDGTATTPPVDNSTRRLLLAEDNAINMKVALRILRCLGFTSIVTAADGVAAVEAVAAAGGPAHFDAILMDLHMPRKGGIEAVQDIIRAWPHQRTQIIAVTADAFEETAELCRANGFTGWLAKPFRVEEFARIMEPQQPQQDDSS